jgi:hypothetical protein
MKKQILISHSFVETIPDNLDEGIVYISIRYKTAIHKCFCGCGFEVVTPLSESNWTLLFHGKSISLDPSIGNWNAKCQSHYWIRRNRVVWSTQWSKVAINKLRQKEQNIRSRQTKREL